MLADFDGVSGGSFSVPWAVLLMSRWRHLGTSGHCAVAAQHFQLLQIAGDDRLGTELGRAFCLVFFPVALTSSH